MRVRTAVLLLAAALALTGCGDAASDPRTSDQPAPSPSGSPSTDPAATSGGPALPAGWRWESFGGVQVGVPGEWGWASSSNLDQWCVREPREDRHVVGRPGPSTAVGCPEQVDGKRAETQAAVTGDVVGFLWAFELGRPDEGDRTTLHLGTVDVIVQTADEALRRQIAGTAHRVDVDAYGCPAQDPIATDPGAAPASAVDVTTLTGVTQVSACRYAVYREEDVEYVPEGFSPLISSLRLDGKAARDVVAAIAAAPEGGGPDNPGDCATEVAYGEEAIVLHVRSDQGSSTLHVFYAGCDHNGFDDGVTVRRLTREGLAPLIAGPNQVMSFSGRAEKQRIILGR